MSGAQSGTRLEDTTNLICENIGRYVRGERLWNVVDKQLGFPSSTFIWTPQSRRR